MRPKVTGLNPVSSNAMVHVRAFLLTFRHPIPLLAVQVNCPQGVLPLGPSLLVHSLPSPLLVSLQASTQTIAVSPGHAWTADGYGHVAYLWCTDFAFRFIFALVVRLCALLGISSLR
jgi:hypothetical protein